MIIYLLHDVEREEKRRERSDSLVDLSRIIDTIVDVASSPSSSLWSCCIIEYYIVFGWRKR